MVDFEDSLMLLNKDVIFQFYRTRLVNLALSQFTYENLPDTCDRLFFEKKLLFNGKAAIMHEPITGDWLSLGYVCNGSLDIYGYPTDIKGVGFNTANVTPDEFVVFYDNPLRQSLMAYIDMYANLLTECHMTFRMNLDKQNIPYIITCGRNQQLSYKNLFSRMQAFQRVFFMKKKEDRENIEALNTNIPYIGVELLTSLRTIWTQAIMFLGIAPSDNVEKKERLNTQEVAFNREESDAMKSERGIGRIEGFKKFNKRFGFDVIVHMNRVDVSFPTDMFDNEINSITHDDVDRTSKMEKKNG